MRIIDIYSFFLIIIFGVIVQCSKPEDPTYKVGVIEFNRAKGKDVNINLEENIVNAGNLLNNFLHPGTPGKDIDIVVFPESVMNTVDNPVYVPDSKNELVLCDEKEQNPGLLNTFSCWAITFKKYLVLNVVEKIECTTESQKEVKDDRPCGQDGLNRYNTEIVFNRKGALIAKYRKVNPYGERLINTTVLPDYVTFDTDFGVKFGVVICFDLLFKTPTQELIEKYGTTDIIFSAHWFSELPFLTANQIQQSWSYANHINFIAAGANAPETGTTGTGIFSGRSGSMVSKMFNYVTTDMLISSVPKTGRTDAEVNNQPIVPPKFNAIPNRLKGLKMLRDKTVDKFESKLIDKKGNTNEKLCHNDICCEFDLEIDTFDKQNGFENYYYRMVAFSGGRSYIESNRTTNFKTCAIIACTDEKSLESCAMVFNDETQIRNYYYFNKIEINGKFNDYKDVLFMPNSVEQSFKPLSVNAFNFTEEKTDGKKSIKMQLNGSSSDLLTFGIFALDYNTSNGRQSLPSLYVFNVAILVLYFFTNLY